MNRKPTPQEEFKRTFGNQWWRLCNLYYINKEGVKTKFVPNAHQTELYKGIHPMTLVLKCRQLGITTGFCLIDLDTCLFNSNMRVCIVADREDDAKEIFEDKIKFAYKNLPKTIQEEIAVTSETKQKLVFSNGSSIRVATYVLGSTLNILHLTEFGMLCKKAPERARDVVINCFNAVHPERGGHIFVESTAEGKEGYFYEFCMEGQRIQQRKEQLTPMTWKFFFFPWFKHPEYRLSDADTKQVEITAYLDEYFESIELKCNVKLSPNQRAWYAKKIDLLGQEDMFKQFPSTPEEAFTATIHGTYYAQLITQARKEGRITSIDYDRGFLVDTWWDLGVGDSTSIWFVQQIGNAIHVIDYYEMSGEPLYHYINYLRSKPYLYNKHYAPFDVADRDKYSARPLSDLAKDSGLIFTPVPRTSLQAGIEAVRRILPRCYFDASRCELGIERLETYRKRWNSTYGCYTSLPIHDLASHAADAFRTGATVIVSGATNDEKMTQARADNYYEMYAPPSALVA